MTDAMELYGNAAEGSDEVPVKTDLGRFSDSGLKTLRNKIDEYGRLLAKGAERASRRHRADLISAVDVDSAADFMGSRGPNWSCRLLGIVGGALLGAALSTFLTAALASQPPSVGGVLLAAITATVGAFMVAFYVAKD